MMRSVMTLRVLGSVAPFGRLESVLSQSGELPDFPVNHALKAVR